MLKNKNMIIGLVVITACALNSCSHLKTCGNESARTHALALAQKGNPNATIVIAPDATRSAQFAAFELRQHLNQITGGDFTIATNGAPADGISILVGDSPAARALKIAPESFGPQEYLIRFLPNTLVLAGRDKADRGKVVYDYMSDPDAFKSWPGMWDEQGTLYAVYDFLERFCGVRWFTHTEVGTVCPENRDLTVKGSEIRHAPRFRYRYVCCYGGAVYADFAGLWPRGSAGFRLWDKMAYAIAYKSGKSDTAKVGCIQLFRRRMREGGDKCVANHSLYQYYDRFWEQSKDPELAKIFVEKKADWFAKGYDGKPPQLCYTSTGLIEQVSRDAVAYFNGESASIGFRSKFQYGENYFAVEPMDNIDFCKCPECQKLLNADEQKSVFFSNGQHSDYFFNFVNEVSRRVKNTNPDKRVTTLAYMSHAAPPECVKLDPSVVVHFCFSGNRLVYDRQSYEHEIKLLTAWADEAKTTKRPLYLWLYYGFPVSTAWSGEFYCFPGFFAHAISEQFKLFERYGCRGMYYDIPYGPEVEAYITYKLMDDPSLNVDALLDEFFTGLYGPAADALKKFYLLVEQTYCDPKNYPTRSVNQAGPIETYNAHQTEEVAWGKLGTAERMAELGKLMEQARAAVAVNGTAAQKTNVDLFDKGVWSYMVAGRKLWLEKTNEITPDNSQKLPDRWKVIMDPVKVGITNKWFATNYDDSLWKEASILEFLEKQGYKDYTNAWYRVSAVVPREWEGKKIILRFGAVDETCWLWINGCSAGELIYNATLDPDSWKKPMRFDITKFVKFGETNQITVLVQNLEGAGGIWKPSCILYKPKDWNPDGFKIISGP